MISHVVKIKQFEHIFAVAILAPRTTIPTATMNNTYTYEP